MEKPTYRFFHLLLRCSNRFLCACCCLFVCHTASGISVKQCERDAKTALEKTYCKILAKGQTLPDFYDFQRNPTATQRLLLNTPARKAGIPLPSTHNENTATGNLSTSNPRPTFNNRNSAAKSAQGKVKKPLPSRKTAATEEFADNSLAGCVLDKKQINCKSSRFFLAINIPLQRLNPRVLEEDNRLSLPDRRKRQSSLQYLSTLYPIYIEKMLLIGLGDSTMSFTKFAALYDQVKEKSESFSARFAEMYELLKKERKTMGIKTRYTENYPENIKSCMQVNQDIIACDDIKQNWVYQRMESF